MDTGTKAKTLDEFEREETEAAADVKRKKPAKAPKQKKAKATKAAKTPKGKADKNDAVEAAGEEPKPEKKRHPVRNALLFTSLFWLLPIALVIVVCWGYEDEYGEPKYLADKDGVIRGPILVFLNPEDRPREEYYSAEFDEINGLIQEKTDLVAEAEARLEELDAREEELDEWETRLQDQEDLLEEGMPSGDGAATAPVTADIAALAKAWSEMTPAKAAAAIGEMSDEAVTLSVLRLVKYKSLGKILDAMSAEEAARISELLAEPPDAD